MFAFHILWLHGSSLHVSVTMPGLATVSAGPMDCFGSRSSLDHVLFMLLPFGSLTVASGFIITCVGFISQFLLTLHPARVIFLSPKCRWGVQT
jgi:hypothetical protein